ncbi:DNA circularization N-terminal domain-containing protein [Lacibacterium aquatile]|uniref:DNA circularization N-terminal domain-containing protein n=1 Tax=Lacibacterium aquatile TaxID=1168082 RepID=A0ABW5DV25_9PROT
MSNLPPLKNASFRGVAFTATSHSVSIGRRLASHQFPQRDLGYQEDIGRQDRSFTLDGYLVGEDVEYQRDQLMAALETPGAGELQHPWLGRLWVVAKPTDLQENRQERRKVTVKLSFTEAEEPRAANPTEKRLSPAATRRTAAGKVRQSGWDMLGGVNMRGAPSFAWDSGRQGLGSLGGMLQAIQGGLPSGNSGYSAGRNARSLVGNADGFLGQPSGIGPLLTETLGGMLGESQGLDSGGRQRTSARVDGYRVSRDMDAYALAMEPSPMPANATRWRRQSVATESRILEGGRLVMLAEASDWLLPGLLDNASSREVAMERVEPLLGWSERERMAAANRRDDTAWRAVGELQQSIRTSAMARPNGLQTARLVTPTPSLVAAHRLYGDAGRWREAADAFVDPYELAHPGFLNGSGRVPMSRGI